MKAIEIRAHHLDLLHRFIVEGREVFDAAKTFKGYRFRDTLGVNVLPSYCEDVLGPSLGTAEVVCRRQIAFCEQFLALDPDDRINITEKRDGICRSCYKGSHCISKDFPPAFGDRSAALEFRPAFLALRESGEDYVVKGTFLPVRIRTDARTLSEVFRLVYEEKVYDRRFAND